MTEGWFSFLYRHHRRPLFILFFLRLEIAIALRIKPGLGSLAANEQKVVGEGGGGKAERRGKKTGEGEGLGEGGRTPKGASGGKP